MLSSLHSSGLLSSATLKYIETKASLIKCLRHLHKKRTIANIAGKPELLELARGTKALTKAERKLFIGTFRTKEAGVRENI